MLLLPLKWSAALIISTLSIAAALASIKIAKKYQRWLSLSDAIANGIFIGAALFHMLPDAVAGFEHSTTSSAYLDACLIACASYALLLLIEKLDLLYNTNKRAKTQAWLTISTLSIHAFITGLALGLMKDLSLFSVMLIAIIIHKCFEIFALVINLTKHSPTPKILKSISFLFTLITPCGILLGSYSHILLPHQMDGSLSAVFNAIAAGTFFFIGIVHREHHQNIQSNTHHQYSNVLASIVGVIMMAILAIWM